jgi:multidrug efflux pump subunit AcrA (membrane-fusion protein)
MRKPARTAAVLLGLGVGAAVGPSLGPAAVWAGVAIAMLGVALSLVGTAESDVVGDRSADSDEDTGMVGDGLSTGTAVVGQRRPIRQRPGFSDLGPHVEQILARAGEIADQHRAEARLEAEGIVTAARREAEAILNRAHEQAAGTTGTGRDLSPAGPTRAPSPDEDPSLHA